MLAMVLIGMDPTPSDNVLRAVRLACDSLGAGMTKNGEAIACAKLVAFGRPLSPANQAHLISLIPAVSRPMVRISRCAARALILDSPVDIYQLEELPDVTPFVERLSPPAGSGAPFDVTGKNANTAGFFEDLTHRLSVLSQALSSIDEYTILERQTKETDHEEGETALEQIKRQLDLLHGRIGERSRGVLLGHLL